MMFCQIIMVAVEKIYQRQVTKLALSECRSSIFLLPTPAEQLSLQSTHWIGEASTVFLVAITLNNSNTGFNKLEKRLFYSQRCALMSTRNIQLADSNASCAIYFVFTQMRLAIPTIYWNAPVIIRDSKIQKITPVTRLTRIK